MIGTIVVLLFLKEHTTRTLFFWPFLAPPPIWIFLVVLELGPKSKNKYQIKILNFCHIREKSGSKGFGLHSIEARC